MSKTLLRIKDYFESHPDANECYEALGKVFVEKEKADKYLAGVAGRYVTTHTREGENFERESDRIKYEIAQQNNVVNQKNLDYEQAPAADKEKFMGEWDAAQKKLAKLESRLQKQLALEEKEELLAKEQKPIKTDLTVPELSVDELKAKILSQQAIVDSNKELVERAPDKKKKAAEKTQAAEIKKLEGLQEQLKTAEAKAAKTEELPTDNK